MIGSGGFLDQGFKKPPFLWGRKSSKPRISHGMETELGFGQTEGMLFSAYICLCVYEYIIYMFKGKNSSEQKSPKRWLSIKPSNVQIQKTLGI